MLALRSSKDAALPKGRKPALWSGSLLFDERRLVVKDTFEVVLRLLSLLLSAKVAQELRARLAYNAVGESCPLSCDKSAASAPRLRIGGLLQSCQGQVRRVEH